ncbi:DUF2269 domain-containing protein [Streptomyces capitiformicae]|uniref:Membrane protein n=1 Tax=Streptomyces capitiformicae TaxID=2014920 RepID=A0A919L846_9ACTN|nr:DUF2269 domain-containing protein [Streptomyces capitiformicae]GHH87418.1 membrane protein [Streptomyces capitiformicae]
MKTSRPVRRAFLVVHVTASACWPGLTLGLLALAITAVTTGSEAVTEASVRGMKLFADWLLIPVGALTFVSGLVLSLGTQWGLARHRWVYVKFWLTLATLTATTLVLRPGMGEVVTAAGSGALPDRGDVLMGPIVSLTAYVFMTVISVLKPWGLTRRGRRLRAAARVRGERPVTPSRPADYPGGSIVPVAGE